MIWWWKENKEEIAESQALQLIHKKFSDRHIELFFFSFQICKNASWRLCQLQRETPQEIDLPTESRTEWQTKKRQPPSNEN